MEEEHLIHDLIVSTIMKRLHKEFSDIKVNFSGERTNAFKDFYPDLILYNHGMVISVIEVETEKTLSPERVEQWKALSESGVKVIVVIPKELKVKATELLWKEGIAGKIGIGTYDINISLP